jgi:predicted nucleic acid-binding protein
VIVLDASAVLEMLLNTRAAPRVTARVFAPGETLHAPHVLDLEVAQALRRYVLAGETEEDRGEEALRDFRDLPLSRYPHEPFLERIWELRRNVTAYDAAYLALAEALDAPFVTRDVKVARAPGHRARIELL